jgi:cytochrome b561
VCLLQQAHAGLCMCTRLLWRRSERRRAPAVQRRRAALRHHALCLFAVASSGSAGKACSRAL